MSEYQLAFITVTGDQLRAVFKAFNGFMLFLWRLGLGSWGNGTRFGGSVMVIKHTGRKTGLARYTPVNYAVLDGDIYCTAGFGVVSDWYRNIMANPQVEVWLPDGWWSGVAGDVSAAENAPTLLHQVIVASGFAGPLFGVNPKELTEEDYRRLLESFRVIRIRRAAAMTGPGGPGDLSWVWPLATFGLLYLLLRRRRR